MSVLDLRRFAYQRRKYATEKNPSRDEESNSIAGKPSCVTPNKAPRDHTTFIPETPDSHWPRSNTPSTHHSGTTAKKVTEKRIHRALSSSDENDSDSALGRIGSSSCLFEGLGVSKRRKRDFDDSNGAGGKENKEFDYDCVRATTAGPASFSDGITERERWKRQCAGRALSAKTSRGSGGVREGGGRDGMTDRLLELFPQHQLSYLDAVCQRCASMSEAVAEIIASGDQIVKPECYHQRRRRTRCLTSDSSPVVEELESGSDSDSLPCMADTLNNHPQLNRIRRPRRLRMLSDEELTPVKVAPSQPQRSRAIIVESSEGESEEEASSPRPSSLDATSGCSSISSSARLKLKQFAFRSPSSASHCKSSNGSFKNRGEIDDCVLYSREGTVKAPIRKHSCRAAPIVIEDSDSDDSNSLASDYQGDQDEVVDLCGSSAVGAESKADAELTHSSVDSLSAKEVEVVAVEEEGEEEEEEEEEECFSPAQRKAILEFLQECSLEEACCVPGLSSTKAKLLLTHQTFVDWDHLVATITSVKGLGEQILDGCLQLLRERAMLEKLLGECRSIASSIQSLVARLHDSKDSSASFKQPAIMPSSLQMKPYQLVGLRWLSLLISQGLNGILADEMGLGKTVQAIAFLAHLLEEGHSGPFLIIVPASTLNNWVRELERWCPALRILTYWGTQTERFDIRFDVLSTEDLEYDVILTTYTTSIGQIEDRKFFRKVSVQCVILDEAHLLKNMTSQRFTYLMKIKAARRVLLTGTPVQNNLLELMSLLSFVMPDIFSKYSEQLKRAFSRAKRLDESSAYYLEQVKQAKQIMQPFVLRRLKSEVLHQLPAKAEFTELCPLTPSQLALYSSVVERGRREVKSTGADTRELSGTMTILMELRKAANHPLLHRCHYTDGILKEMATSLMQTPSHRDANRDYVLEDMTVMSDFELHSLCLSHQCLSRFCLSADAIQDSGKFAFLTSRLRDMKAKGDRVLLFSQFTMVLDIIEVFLQQQHHSYLRLDGHTPVDERQQLIDRYNSSSDIFIFLLTTRAGGLGINLTSANVVIIHDIDFNPYNDKQAEDRCHRVGQTRKVTVLRLVSQKTIEGGILSCAQKKLKLEQDMSLTDEIGAADSADIASLIKQSLGLK